MVRVWRRARLGGVSLARDDCSQSHGSRDQGQGDGGFAKRVVVVPVPYWHSHRIVSGWPVLMARLSV